MVELVSNMHEHASSYPTGVTPQNIESVERHSKEGNSLPASIALAIIDEVKVRIKAEWVELKVGVASEEPTQDWEAFIRPAYAILNAESMIKTGQPFQSPGHDWEAFERESRVSLGEIFDEEDQEFGVQRKTTGEIVWVMREADFAELYENTDSPQDFIDAVVRKETERLHEELEKDIKTQRGLIEFTRAWAKEREPDREMDNKDEAREFIEDTERMEIRRRVIALECGRDKYHRLYDYFNH